MKIEIPEWAEEGYIDVIMNGVERIAFKNHGKDSPIMIKVERCNQCGECCLDIGKGGPFGSDDEGKCTKLVRNAGKWECTAGQNRAVRCLRDPNKNSYPECSVEYREQ